MLAAICLENDQNDITKPIQKEVNGSTFVRLERPHDDIIVSAFSSVEVCLIQIALLESTDLRSFRLV